jgi:hypothetical protein
MKKILIICITVVILILGAVGLLFGKSSWAGQYRDWTSHDGAELKCLGDGIDSQLVVAADLKLPRMRISLSTSVASGEFVYKLKSLDGKVLETKTIKETDTVYFDLSELDCDSVELYVESPQGTKGGIDAWVQYKLTNRQYYYYKLPFVRFPLNAYPDI